MEDWQVVLISMLVSLIPMAIAKYIDLKKAPTELEINRSDAVLNYAEAAGKMAEQNAELTREIAELKKTIVSMQLHITCIEARVRDRDTQIAEWQRGIERLCHQIKAYNQVPVWCPAEAAGKDGS